MELRSLEEVVADAERFDEPNKQLGVLVIDDEQTVLDVVEEIVRDMGHTVRTALNAADGLELIDQHSPRVVVVDKNLPDRSGLEVVLEGKLRHPATEFIVITGYGSMESVIRAMELGAFGYLAKPFANIEDVQQRVQRALDKNWMTQFNGHLVLKLRAAYEMLWEMASDVVDKD